MADPDVHDLAQRTVDAFNAHDIDALRAMSAESDEDWAVWDHTLREFYRAFPDYRITVRKIIAGDDAFALFYRVSATHTAEFPAGELEGVPASGRTLSWDEAVYREVEGGKVVGGTLVVSGVERLQQMGVLPESRHDVPA
jgi:predicted ester cyclase